MVRIVPEISIEIDLSTQDLIVMFLSRASTWVTLPPVKKASHIIIRANDFKMYKFEGRQKTLDKLRANSSTAEGCYLDPLDAEMLVLRHEAATQSSSQQNPKWMNLCWDAFRIVDNHSKSHIFQTVMPSHLQSRKQLT
jgi:hypothetical protein